MDWITRRLLLALARSIKLTRYYDARNRVLRRRIDELERGI